MTENSLLMTVIAVIFIVGAWGSAGLLVYGIFRLIRRGLRTATKAARQTAKAIGTVGPVGIGHRRHWDENAQATDYDVWLYEVTFTDESGNEHVLREVMPCEIEGIGEGSTVEVSYNPNDPEDAAFPKLEAANREWAKFVIGVLVFSALFMVVAPLFVELIGRVLLALHIL